MVIRRYLHSSACTKESRMMHTFEKWYYLAAVKCLMTKPTKYGPGTDIPGAKNRFDDFHGVHIQQTMSIHFVGHFLPWHRYFVRTYEKALRDECFYFGAQPYWDWTIDADKAKDFNKSELFDEDDGFGGDGIYVAAEGPFVIPGHTGGGCVTTGPFKNMELHVGPGNSLTNTPRCLKRDFAASINYKFANTAKVNGVLAKNTYVEFMTAVDGETNWENMGIHGPGHYSIGGEAGDMFSSPGEPIFYLHHANLDRVWWKWQSAKPSVRLTEIGGPVNMMNMPPGANVTLSYPLNLGRLAPQITVADVMDISKGKMCYKY
ncbi:hypothetical protein DFH27DRAFT_50436 [Peziza echinospora]|nr:hypothetical protein DFH27DRAFT_50436 [Peziza echinospora]